MSEVHLVEEMSRQIVSLAVTVADAKKIKKGIFLSGCLYEAIHGLSNIEVINRSEQNQSVYINEPLEVVSFFSNDYFEVKLDTMEPIDTEHVVDLNVVTLVRDRIKPIHFKEILRTDHLNEEKRRALFNHSAKYQEIFFCEENQLTFTNMVKHPINTTDDVPIYIKPYRYGFNQR